MAAEKRVAAGEEVVLERSENVSLLGTQDHPSGAKALPTGGLCGTTKVVPFPQSVLVFGLDEALDLDEVLDLDEALERFFGWKVLGRARL